jgi:hypothetical protein
MEEFSKKILLKIQNIIYSIPNIKFQIFKDRIYTSNSMKNILEIEVYDFNGKLIKKIKSYKAGPIWNFLKNKVYFQDYFSSI